jgi:hypothetical protein
MSCDPNDGGAATVGFCGGGTVVVVVVEVLDVVVVEVVATSVAGPLEPPGLAVPRRVLLAVSSASTVR